MATINFNNDFLYGMIGGFTGTLVSHPFDTIKTRIQSNTSKNIIDAVKMKRLYAGLPAPLFGIMMEKSIVFGSYNMAKKHNINDFCSGIIGGFMCTMIVTPIDKIKIHFQNKNTNKFNIMTMYRGFIPTICRETPGFGIYFTTYNYLTSCYNKESNMAKTFSFGALSGLNAWIFIYPSDLIKTRMQSSSDISIMNTIRSTYNENNMGCRNFYKGFSLAIMRAMPLHGGVFLGYELSKRYI
jgi:solute carrier family 25 carnitine/acylcarnitine transporter 20/29